MTSPVELITVECPKCLHWYKDWRRPSMNLDMDDFDDEYMREASTTKCPECGTVVDLDVLVVGPGDVWQFSNPPDEDSAAGAIECPQCQSKNVARIQYGLPAMCDELQDALNSGRLVLGGCCVSPDSPLFCCNDCGWRGGRSV